MNQLITEIALTWNLLGMHCLYYVVIALACYIFMGVAPVCEALFHVEQYLGSLWWMMSIEEEVPCTSIMIGLVVVFSSSYYYFNLQCQHDAACRLGFIQCRSFFTYCTTQFDLIDFFFKHYHFLKPSEKHWCLWQENEIKGYYYVRFSASLKRKKNGLVVTTTLIEQW